MPRQGQERKVVSVGDGDRQALMMVHQGHANPAPLRRPAAVAPGAPRRTSRRDRRHRLRMRNHCGRMSIAAIGLASALASWGAAYAWQPLEPSRKALLPAPVAASVRTKFCGGHLVVARLADDWTGGIPAPRDWRVEVFDRDGAPVLSYVPGVETVGATMLEVLDVAVAAGDVLVVSLEAGDGRAAAWPRGRDDLLRWEENGAQPRCLAALRPTPAEVAGGDELAMLPGGRLLLPGEAGAGVARRRAAPPALRGRRRREVCPHRGLSGGPPIPSGWQRRRHAGVPRLAARQAPVVPPAFSGP